jgi:ankyrin repeat protein
VLRYNTAFLRACKAGDLNTAEILLSKGANIEARNNGQPYCIRLSCPNMTLL